MKKSPAEISEAVESAREELIAFLQKMVQTASLPNHEHEVQNLVAQKLRALGLEVEIVPSNFDDLKDHPAFGDDGFSPTDRVNVIGRWPGTHTGEGKSIILNGHVDVVPVGDLSLWVDSPWSGVIREGKMFGRGSCDMKSGLCAGIFAVDVLQRLGYQPARDVLIESVIGEESGGIGTLTTIVKGYTADAVILLEPTRLEISPVQSGALTFRLTVPGRSIHAAMKAYGVSAIEKFALLLNAINKLDVERHANFKHPLFEDPHNIAPINIGTVRGGEWHSTVPEEVVAEGRMGVFPGESNETARKMFEAAIQAAAESDAWLSQNPPRVEWFEGQFESGETPLDHPLIQQLTAAHEHVTGSAPTLRGVTYGSDMRLFTNHAKIAATHYGPGDVGMAHAVNEFVPLEEVVTATKVVANMVAQWCGGEFK
ncbi:ArgE/DapE family deacylase [Candidatus Villigracilis affinis]|uniref:ArgE/DapE family deacylase n=1 Tax=Candidatus Villigracilis affinis TaxID=3140682 RepID=UPI001DFAE1AB|nr:ArgE/DapE family deacylase [Anaerolineales bacterium]